MIVKELKEILLSILWLLEEELHQDDMHGEQCNCSRCRRYRQLRREILSLEEDKKKVVE